MRWTPRYIFGQLARMVVAGSVLVTVFFVFADLDYSKRWVIILVFVSVGLVTQGVRWWQGRHSS